MALVGDIILELRSRIPDAPAVQNPPALISVTPVYDPNGGWPTGSAQVAVTASNTWGETQMAPGSPITVPMVAPNNALDVVIGGQPPPHYLYYNVYSTGSPGYTLLSRTTYANPTPWINPVTVRIGVTTNPGDVRTGASGGPPLNHFTAFLPDEDGNFLGAYHAYRMLNRALSAMVKIAGGIIDITGVQSQINTSMYRLASPFYQFVNAWYDGYPMDIVPRSMMYLRNSAAGFSGILSYEQDGPQSVVQVWPQSNRTGGSNQLASSMDTEDLNFSVFDGSGFLSIGLVQVNQEIMGYSLVQQVTTSQPPPFNKLWQFSGLVRGLGGTDIVAHNPNEPVTELNIRMSGYRMCETYNVGDALKTLMVPQAWEEPLVLHMLSQVRSMEQDEAASKELLAQFVADAEKIAKGSRLGRMKPRQIPIWGQTGTDARNVNGIGFGWLIN